MCIKIYATQSMDIFSTFSSLSSIFFIVSRPFAHEWWNYQILYLLQFEILDLNQSSCKLGSALQLNFRKCLNILQAEKEIQLVGLKFWFLHDLIFLQVLVMDGIGWYMDWDTYLFLILRSEIFAVFNDGTLSILNFETRCLSSTALQSPWWVQTLLFFFWYFFWRSDLSSTGYTHMFTIICSGYGFGCSCWPVISEMLLNLPWIFTSSVVLWSLTLLI